jgi:hypothetical protein
MFEIAIGKLAALLIAAQLVKQEQAAEAAKVAAKRQDVLAGAQ